MRARYPPSMTRDHPHATEVRVVLVHSPLLGRDSWLHVAEALRARACQVVLPRLTDFGVPPFWTAHVDAVVDAIGDPEVDGSPLVLVLHDGAGQVADHLTAELDRQGHTVEAVVFADAGLPFDGGSRVGQLRLEDPALATDLIARIGDGQRYPDWTDAQLRPLVPDGARRRRLLDGMRTMPLDYWTEAIPGAEPPSHHRAVLLFSGGYAHTADVADAHNWPLIDLRADNHFLPLADEQLVAEAILGLVDVLLDMPDGGALGRSR